MADERTELGRRGERLAVEHLRGRGYSIVGRNFRTRHGELDVIACDERVLVFCEVKTRMAAGPDAALGPLSKIGPLKRRRLRMVASEWLHAGAGPERPRTSGIRFDAIAVTFRPGGHLVALEHLEEAF